MHVLFVTSYYPYQQHPIVGIFFHDQAVALHEAGHQVGVITAPRLNVTLELVHRCGLAALRPVTRDDYFPDFPVYRMHWGWFPRVLPPMVSCLIRRAGFNAYEMYCEKHGKPDVIHGFNIFYGGYLAARLKEKYGVPTVLTEVSSGFLEGQIIFPGQPGIIRRTLRGVDARCVCGSSLLKPVGQYAPEQHIRLIGLVIDTDYFTLSDRQLPPKPFIFLTIAQLVERRKALAIMLKSFAHSFRGQEVELYIRGDGPLKSELQRLAQELGIDQQVKFLSDYMTREELRDLIRRSHALVSSSTVETFAVSVAEALACGKPVVATRSGGPEDYVTERSGILVPPGDIQALAEAMTQMVKDYDRYDPQQVRADCTEQFSRERYVIKLQNLYEEALQTIG